MHVLLHFESHREAARKKTVEMLRTMGASVLIAGISTFLRTLPLAFSTSRNLTQTILRLSRG
jgi:Niemann-Pick C1 protein